MPTDNPQGSNQILMVFLYLIADRVTTALPLKKVDMGVCPTLVDYSALPKKLGVHHSVMQIDFRSLRTVDAIMHNSRKHHNRAYRQSDLHYKGNPSKKGWSGSIYFRGDREVGSVPVDECAAPLSTWDVLGVTMSGPTLVNLIKGSVYRVSPLVSVRVNPVKETIGLALLHKRDRWKTLKKVRVRSASCSRRPLVFITMGW